MGLVVLIVCLVIVVRRRRRGVTIVVPAVLAGVALLDTVGAAVALVHVAEAVASVNPADKATLLANSISEALNAFAFGLLIEIPLLVAVYFLDRWLRKRQALNSSTSSAASQ